MFPVKKRPNVIAIEKEIDARYLESVLKDHGIPYHMVSYHDSAYAGLFQLEHGWGHVEVPADRVEEVEQLYREVVAAGPRDSTEESSEE
ncbi:MAG: hypothetical protein K9L66_10665 [Spirochaetaceae bacterium]|nr:hypothetical protein [Spirochaetaceae bacterium]MCF7949781.1 hypothetical protein [Spirochaetia bacterium]MCF7951989.1 hypothetical protein [Spirochaetaceae bacterium]